MRINHKSVSWYTTGSVLKKIGCATSLTTQTHFSYDILASNPNVTWTLSAMFSNLVRSMTIQSKRRFPYSLSSRLNLLSLKYLFHLIMNNGCIILNICPACFQKSSHIQHWSSQQSSFIYQPERNTCASSALNTGSSEHHVTLLLLPLMLLLFVSLHPGECNSRLTWRFITPLKTKK